MNESPIRNKPIEQSKGIQCPRCGKFDLKVYRTTRQNGKIRRQRYCRCCGHGPIFTYESRPERQNK